MNKKIIILAVFVLMISLFTACAPAEKPLDDYGTNDPNNYNGRGDNMNNDYDNLDMNQRVSPYQMGYPDNDNVNINDQVATENERRLESRINQINGVTDCVVVLDGNTAYVGLNATEQMSANEMTNLRQRVSNQIKQAQPNIATVYVTTDTVSIDNMMRIRNNADYGNNRTSKMMDSIKGLFE